MSLTLYFYKTKKGNVPTCKNGTEWTSCRRAYITHAIMLDMADITVNKRGFSLFKMNDKILQRLLRHVNDSVFSYDGMCEHELWSWLNKRKFNWDKYDYFVLVA